MAQSKPNQRIQETQEGDSKKESASRVPFKFNAQAPEFVPRTHTQIPVSGYFYPCYQYQLGGSSGSDWIYVGDQDSIPLVTNTEVMIPNYSRDVLTEDLQQKIIKQVEYQFSGLSLLANDSLVKQINKDPEGYVPISVIASTKKIKSLISNNHLLAQTLRSSSKLVVSNDGKKVRRKHPFTEKEKEDLQSRTVVAENLPEDHSHQNIEKMFSVVGSVKNIRICHPQDSNSPRSKGDFVICNKLHALVEYETTEMAEKAVDKLNDERNWRKDLRVRLLLRCSPKSVLKSRKPEFDWCFDDEDESPSLESLEDFCQRNNYELAIDTSAEESSAGSRKGSWRGRGKPAGLLRSQSQSRNGGRGLLVSPSPQSVSVQCEASSSPRQISKGPRMPDGTRGFTMGRGKPICTL